VGVLGLIDTIMSVRTDDVTEESLAQLQRICKKAGDVDGSYASWFEVALAHAVHQRGTASSEVPEGQEMLKVAV